jgi:integrase
MAEWQAQGKYPGIYRDAADPHHWRVVVNLGRAAKGQPRRRAVKVLNGTLTDARAEHTKLQGQRDKREIMPQATKAPKTVDEWFPIWLEKYKRRDLERSTLARYENYHRLYISPHIGSARLRGLTPEDLQDFNNALSDSGLAPGTSFQVVALLRQVIKQAITVGIMTRDPLVGVKMPPRPGRRKLHVPSDEELRAMLDAMRAAKASAYPITRMALATGMREGELIALEWSSVDLKAGNVHVCRSAARVPAGPNGGRFFELEFKTTKTDESTDDVPLDPDTVEWLKEHRKTVAETKLALRPRFWTDADGDLVFPCLSTFAGSPAGRAWQAGSLRKAFGAYAEKAGLGYLRFHDLRHCYGAVLHRNGVPLLTISRLMRHKSIKTTADVYGHVGAEQRREAAQALTGMWGRA